MAYPFIKRKMIRNFSYSLDEVPDQETIERLIKLVKKRYPGVYKVLIYERNKILAKNLYKLMNTKKNVRILAIMGAGHKKEVERLISEWN